VIHDKGETPRKVLASTREIDLRVRSPPVRHGVGTSLHRRLGGTDQKNQWYWVVEIVLTEQEVDSIEEIFGQIWVIPKEDKIRVPNSQDHGDSSCGFSGCW
jgi:hypothetical protein